MWETRVCHVSYHSFLIIYLFCLLLTANRAVEEAAFGVLYYLSCNRDIPASQKREMCLEENIFVLLATMNSMIDSEVFCQKACGLILNLSFFAPISQDAMASGTNDDIVAVRCMFVYPLLTSRFVALL